MARAATAKKTPAKKAAPKKEALQDSSSNPYGIKWLMDHLNQATGRTLAQPNVRGTIRRLIKNGDVPKEVKDGGRYNFDGPNDPSVGIILETINGEGTKKRRGRKPKAAKEAEEVESEVEDVEELDDEEEDLEDLDLDDDE
jgi:hypothetical protein